MHRWRGARVKLLTEATCLQDAVPPHLERYLLRGRFDVEQTYWCAVSRSTSTRGARDDELAVLKKQEGTKLVDSPHAKNNKICAGYLVSEPSDDAGRRWLENWEAYRFCSLACRQRTKLGCP